MAKVSPGHFPKQPSSFGTFFTGFLTKKVGAFDSQLCAKMTVVFIVGPERQQNPIKQALRPCVTAITQGLRAYFYTNLGGTLKRATKQRCEKNSRGDWI